MTATRWVVGEAFRSSARHEEILCLTGLLDAIARGGLDPEDKLFLKAGQGISAHDWAGLAAALRARGIGSVVLGAAPPDPVHRSLVFKHQQGNVVISHPRREGPQTFSAELVCPDHTEMVADHTADEQHLPGMLLIEAAIQLVTAVVVEHFPNLPARPARYAVMHACRFEFHRFAFPLALRLTLRLDPAGPAEPERVPLRAEVSLEQAGRVAATAHFDLHAFDPASIFAVEHAQARKAVTQLTEEG